MPEYFCATSNQGVDLFHSVLSFVPSLTSSSCICNECVICIEKSRVVFGASKMIVRIFVKHESPSIVSLVLAPLPLLCLASHSFRTFRRGKLGIWRRVMGVMALRGGRGKWEKDQTEISKGGCVCILLVGEISANYHSIQTKGMSISKSKEELDLIRSKTRIWRQNNAFMLSQFFTLTQRF